MDKFNVRHTAFALILFFSIGLFFQLGRFEIQPWDEGLYAYRAKAVYEKGVWWDQTEHSIGGLYSSSYPPLTVWAMALSMKFIEPHHAVRLFSAVCGSFALFMIYLLGRRILNVEMSLLAIIGLAVTLIWNKYSRLGMTDVPVVTLSLISLWSILKIKESARLSRQFLFVFFFILSFAAALMSKVLVSFLPLSFVLVFMFEKGLKSQKTLLIIGTVGAISAALPWHFHMIITYGHEFYKVFFASHIYSAVEGNTSNIGFFYYLNQLIIANPFFILAILLTVMILIKRKVLSALIQNRDSYLTKVVILWFGILLLLFSVSMTKLPHYLVYLVVPALLLGCLIFQEHKVFMRTGRKIWLLLSLILLSFIWSLSFELRQGIKLLLTLNSFSLSGFLFLISGLFLLIVSFVFSDSQLRTMGQKILPRLSYAILTILVVRLIVYNFMLNPANITGGLETAEYLKRTDKNTYVYVYHKHNQSDKFNPQLAWYTNGWNIGKVKGKSVINVPLPKRGIDFNVIADTDSLYNLHLIYYIPDDKNLARTVIRELRQTRPIIKHTKNYIIFGAYHWARPKGKKV